MASRNSVKSTWPLDDRSKWGPNHHLIHHLNAYPETPGTKPPVYPKTDKVPYLVEWKCHLWVLLHGVVPFAIHQAYTSATGASLHPVLVFALYFGNWGVTLIREIHCLRRLGEKIGYLDGEVHSRDGIPDTGVNKVAASLWKTTGTRIAMATYLAYDTQKSPLDAMSDPRWFVWLYFQIGLYGIILDFWFYLYHRLMHDVSFLWQYHRTHHLTKHPNATLTAYADHEQEFFDMIVIPFLTWGTFRVLGIPLGFYEWWICHQYITFTELLGHSGLRAYGTALSTLTWALKLLGSELIIEDHDLHHRTGWRKSHNYGKQTKLWDKLFGTGIARIESSSENVDWDTGVYVPL